MDIRLLDEHMHFIEKIRQSLDLIEDNNPIIDFLCPESVSKKRRTH